MSMGLEPILTLSKGTQLMPLILGRKSLPDLYKVIPEIFIDNL